METKQLQKSTKWDFKLKLEQPAVMCSGRKPITCYYRAKQLPGEAALIIVEFASKGETTIVCFINGECITPGWENLKILKRLK